MATTLELLGEVLQRDPQQIDVEVTETVRLFMDPREVEGCRVPALR